MTGKMTVLPNGLKIVTDTMDEVDTVSLGIWVDIGAMYEPAEINGISHLLEHMAFKQLLKNTLINQYQNLLFLKLLLYQSHLL